MTDEENKLIEEIIERSKEHYIDDVEYSVELLISLIKKESKEIEELKNTETYKLAIIDKDKYVSKDKIKPIQIIDLDGKIHNVYKIEEK